MIALEDSLTDALSDDSEVDGHDAGSGEVNIFISTSRPVEVFQEIRSVLQQHDLLASARAAFREESGDDYTILWPEGLDSFNVT
jgi:hypothetical protein